MKRIVIRYPIWKTQSVGIANYKITEDLIVEILHRKKNGNKLYPNPFFITKEKARSYPIQIVKKNVKLHIIPINDMEEIRESGNNE